MSFIIVEQSKNSDQNSSPNRSANSSTYLWTICGMSVTCYYKVVSKTYCDRRFEDPAFPAEDGFAEEEIVEDGMAEDDVDVDITA